MQVRGVSVDVCVDVCVCVCAGAAGTWPSSPGTRNAASPPSLRPPSRSSWTVGGGDTTDTFTAVQQEHPTVPASYTWHQQQQQQQGSSSDNTTAVTGTTAFSTDTDVLSDVTSVPTLPPPPPPPPSPPPPPPHYTEAPPSCGEEYPTGMPPPPPPEVRARVCVGVCVCVCGAPSRTCCAVNAPVVGCVSSCVRLRKPSSHLRGGLRGSEAKNRRGVVRGLPRVNSSDWTGRERDSEPAAHRLRNTICEEVRGFLLQVRAPPPTAAAARPPPASATARGPSARPHERQRRSVSTERRPRWNQRTPAAVSSSSLHSGLSTHTSSSRHHSASPQRRRTPSKVRHRRLCHLPRPTSPSCYWGPK